jgi:Zn-dependent protease
MSIQPAETTKKCVRCSEEIAAGLFACPVCHALVYRDALEQIASEAKALEDKDDYCLARERWLAGMELLPSKSNQAQWIRDHLLSLEESAPNAASPKSRLIARVGSIISTATIFGKLKSVLLFIKFNFVFSLAAFVFLYWRALGLAYGFGIAMLVLAHEMGHYIEAKRRGIGADLPIFLPGLGAFVKLKSKGVPDDVRAAISLSGPAFGALSAVLCASLWWMTREPIWAVLASTAAWFNAFNLVPVAILDGAHILPVLNAGACIAIATVGLALWQFSSQGVFMLLAAFSVLGVIGRSQKEARSQKHNYALTAGFAAVLTALASILWLMPKIGK